MLRYYISNDFPINHTYVTTKQMSNPHAINTMPRRNRPSSLNNGYVGIAYCPCTPLYSSIEITKRALDTLVKLEIILLLWSLKTKSTLWYILQEDETNHYNQHNQIQGSQWVKLCIYYLYKYIYITHHTSMILTDLKKNL